jgi:hypothetical protein
MLANRKRSRAMGDLTLKDWKLLFLGAVIGLLINTLGGWVAAALGGIDWLSASAPLKDINVEFWIAQVTVPAVLLFFYGRRFKFSLNNHEVVMQLMLGGMGVGFLMVFGFNLPRIDEWIDFIRREAIGIWPYFFIPCSYLMYHLVQLIRTGEGSFDRREAHAALPDKTKKGSRKSHTESNRDRSE